MLHNTTRERLLQGGQGYTALVLDALFSVGFQPYERFTADQAIEALKPYGTSAKLIRIGLKSGLLSPRGRRYVVYTMPAPSTARKLVNGSDLGIRDELPPSAYKSLPAYREALHHALIARRPGIYQRHLLARRLGVCKQTTRNYDRRAGHKVTDQSVTRDIMQGDLDNMPTTKQKGGKKRSWLVQVDQDGIITKHAPMVRGIALKWMREGWKVQISTQTANHYQAAQTSPYASGEFAAYINS